MEGRTKGLYNICYGGGGYGGLRDSPRRKVTSMPVVEPGSYEGVYEEEDSLGAGSWLLVALAACGGGALCVLRQRKARPGHRR